MDNNLENLTNPLFLPLADDEAMAVYGGSGQKFTYIGDTQNPDGTVVNDYVID